MVKRIYVGLDVHQNSIVAAWKARDGKLRHLVVSADEPGLKKLRLAIEAEEVWAAYEASSCGWEVHDQLTQAGWKVSVLAPTHIARSVRGRKRKTDKEDATLILDVLMSHGELGTKLPAVWVPNQRVRDDREVVRRRLTVAEKLGQVKAEIRSLLRMHPVKGAEAVKDTWSGKHRAWLKGLVGEKSPYAGSVKHALASQLRELEFLIEEVGKMQKEVETLAQEEAYRRPVEKMTEVQGVGTVTAMTYLLELGDVHRFQNRRQIGSYLGLVPTSHESGENQDRKGRISRMGPARIRKVLNQAVWSRVSHDEAFRQKYRPLANRTGAKKAIVAMMRKLGIELWHLAKSA